MRNIRKMSPGRNTMRGAASIGLTMIIAIIGSGCDGLLEVDLPGQVTADALNDPGMAETLVTGTITDFECAYGQYVARTGLLTDEFITSAGWRAINIVDARLQDASSGNCATSATSTSSDAWGPLQRARFQAADSYDRIRDFPDEEVQEKERLLATSAAYGGYSLALLGEGYCRGVIDEGPELSREDLWGLAEERFSSAIQHAQTANEPSLLSLAFVGRARVRLNLEQWGGAAADAEQVPESFVFNATYSTADPRRYNAVHRLNRPNNFISVHPGFRELTVQGVPDTRVVLEDGERTGHDGITEMYYVQKYPSLSSPIPMGSWREAQTIIAEVHARTGDLESAVQAINRLRETADLPHFESSDAEAIFQQVIEERRRELFAQGHRVNEKLRHDLPWDDGSTHKGEPYGHVTCMELPDDEIDNNPNL